MASFLGSHALRFRSFAMVFYAALGLGFAACSPTEPMFEDASLRIETDRVVYAAGDSVRLTLVNDGGISIGWEACPLLLERREGASWVEFGSRIGFQFVVCNAYVTAIDPGAAESLPVVLPAGVPSGSYRFRFENLAPADRYGRTKLPLELRVSNRFTLP